MGPQPVATVLPTTVLTSVLATPVLAAETRPVTWLADAPTGSMPGSERFSPAEAATGAAEEVMLGMAEETLGMAHGIGSKRVVVVVLETREMMLPVLAEVVVLSMQPKPEAGRVALSVATVVESVRTPARMGMQLPSSSSTTPTMVAKVWGGGGAEGVAPAVETNFGAGRRDAMGRLAVMRAAAGAAVRAALGSVAALPPPCVTQ